VKRPDPKNSTFAWTPPKSQAAPQVRVDPNAKRVAELPERRNANASVYRLSDGREQEVLSAYPVHYQDAHGAWQPIDTSVVPVHQNGFSVGNETNAYRSYFSSSADQLVRLEQGSAFVQMGADGAHVGAPTVSKDTVTYTDALPGASLNYQVGAQALKEQIVLSKAPASGTAYSFTLKVGGFEPRQRPDGSIAFYGAESNQAALVIPAPYMSDAKPDASSPYGTAYSTKVSQTMTWDAKSGTLHLTIRPDATWLADTHRVYPVVIDPTILVSPAPSQAANVMIGSDVPTTNFDTNWRLSVGTTASAAYRTLIKFPLPSVPAGTTITSANLNLYYDQTFTTGSNNVSLEAHQATAAWDPTTATWNNASGFSGALAGSTVKQANVVAVWNSYPVTSTVQAWLNGTTPNYGFVVKAANESTMGQGGPRYEASIYAYQGETINYPQLVITYGVPGVALDPPSVIHSTGAELSWSAYQNNTGDANNNIVEYQVHRSIYQTFTPDASTEVAPVAVGSTNFVDTTAQPTPTSSSDPYGNAYYYMVAVKTANGALIPAPTKLVRLPKAGLTTVLVRRSSATTLSSAQPNAVLNTLPDTGVAQQWLEVGDNSATYGNARAVFDFGALPASIPANAKISEAHLKLWQETTSTGTSGAVYELHALTRGFTGSQATWNNANSTTAWTTPGGDFNPTAAGTVSNLTNDPNRQNFDATGIVQGWVNTPTSNHGLEVKVANESGAQERTLFAGPNTAEPLLAPTMVVTYLDPASGTYYAPSTPGKMVPGTTYTVPVTVNNTTGSTWSASNQQLTYHWTLPDGTDVTTSSNQLSTALPADMAPGSQQTVNAQVTPPTPADTNSKGQYTLAWDMKNTTTGTYLSGSNGIGSLKQATGVEEPGSNQIGLEKFYQYTARATGAGSALYTNASSGNTVWNYNALSNPSRGFATFVRMSYNSLDTTDTTTGFGWSVQVSTPTRLGTPLDFHPNPNPTEVTFTDGDGTSHVFTWNSTAKTWTSPPGVHLYLQQLASCGPQTTNARAWEMTKPDRTQFFYDCEGYPTAVVDKDGNEADFTYSGRQSENKPEEFLAYITDPTGRKTLTVNYYNKGDNYNYIDSTGNLASGTNLTDPSIIDHVKSIVDISGREVDFLYTTNGLLARMVDGAGNSAAKTFNFSYDATQGMKNVKLVQVTDPRGNATKISYYDPVTDPKFHWWTQSISDRLGHTTAAFAYTEPGAITNSAVQTTVKDANNNSDTYQLDSTGRLLQSVNALNQKTTLAWDGDNNVTSLTENNGAVITWTYDQNTGYPLSMKDALANKNNTAATTYTYQTSLNGHVADITGKVSPAGRHWHFAYDANGNLTSVQDPNGTAAGSGYTTTYTYDSVGNLLSATDANNHTTTYSNYDPSGYPDTTKDPLGNVTTTAYGPRGEVTSVTDALGHATTHNYDIFLRPLDSKTPKDQANGVYITTAAPVYDSNDNVTQTTAPNGAVSTAAYDANDRKVSATAPQDTSSSPTRTTTYSYDAVGNQLTMTTPDGNVSGAAAGLYTTTTAYDVVNQPTSVTDAAGNKTTASYDDVGTSVTVDSRVSGEGSSLPTISSASCLGVVCFGSAEPTVVPRRMTVISSATDSTSPSLCEMKMTVRPSALSSRRLSKRASTSCGTRTAVGSSRMRVRAPR
jgi:YD repeat-containing protein